MPRILLFASGSGTNAANICTYFDSKPGFEIVGLCCNKKGAGVIDRLSPFQVPVYLFSREDCYKSQNLLKVVNACKPDLIVLAGFLWLIPKELVRAYPNQIVNIHPALLPNYGGKGMYGMHVHESVKANGETETGITIHYVNDHYDEGAIIFQAKCPVVDSDTAETIAKKVHELEYANYPKVLEQILLEKQTL